MTAPTFKGRQFKVCLSPVHLLKFRAFALVSLFVTFLLLQPAVANDSTSKEADKANASKDKPVNRPVRDKWAVVVGVSKFKNPKLNLDCSARDAHDVYDYLVNKGHFKPDHIVLLTDEDATRENILSVVGDKWLPRLALPDDLVFLYFSGHGSPSSFDVGGANYLLAYDSDPRSLFVTGISMQDIGRIIRERVHTDRLVLVLDACHSGSAKPGSKGISRHFGNMNVKDLVHGVGQIVISSSEPNQRSWESMRYKGSVFTKHFIDGLSENGDVTSLGEAFEYMKDKVQEEVLRDRGVLQTPVMKSKWTGPELILAAKPSRPRSGLAFTPASKEVVAINIPQTFNQSKTIQKSSKKRSKKKFKIVSKKNLSKIKVKVAPKKSKFTITIETGKHSNAAANANITIVMGGKKGETEKIWKINSTHRKVAKNSEEDIYLGKRNRFSKSIEAAFLPPRI